MDKAAKRILDGLETAKVSAADRKRTRKLIDEAHDWNRDDVAEIESVARFVCGVGELPPLGEMFLRRYARQLMNGLSKRATVDAWDRRALDVIAAAKATSWFWELDSWARDRVVAFPDQPILDDTLELFRARGLWKTDGELVASMFGHFGGFTTKQDTLTSTGRWLLARLDDDANAVFAAAQKHDSVSDLYRILLGHRPELFDTVVAKLQLKSDSDKSYLAEVMLEADANKYEPQVVALVAKLEKPVSAALSARNLAKHYPGKYRTDIKRLLLAAVTHKNQVFILDNDTADTKQLAYELAYPALGDEGLEIWDAYKEPNDALRLDFYATIAKQAKTKALPYLVAGLVYPKHPNATYGFVTHAKYVTRMCELLKPYDLAPHRARIQKKFSKTKDRKIREQIAKLLGKPVATKRTKPFPAKSGYAFDNYAASLVAAALAALKKQKLPEPIEHVKLGGMQGEVRLEHLEIEGVGDTVSLTLRVAKSKVPSHVDYVDDNVLATFAKLHDLGDEQPMWGDMYELPWCVLLHEQIGAAQVIVAALKKRGVKVSKKCKIGVGESDNFWDSQASYAHRSHSNIAALPEAQQADFAAVCFATPAKQRWLLNRKR